MFDTCVTTCVTICVKTCATICMTPCDTMRGDTWDDIDGLCVGAPYREFVDVAALNRIQRVIEWDVLRDSQV